ncbi:hypothetical protein [Parapedobacter sp. 2B3]|uniref:hypothetical protein n=1 Tax=Parapedobacter sp. 2B3 TaxID=3342381 RepID=UPI0035B63E5B
MESTGYEVFTDNGKTVVVCGTDHGIKVPNNEMFVRLDSLLSHFQPQLVLVESYTPIDANREDAARGGDASYCNFWGAAHGVPVHCWSDDWEEIFAQVKEKFSAEQAVLLLMSLYDTEYYSNWSSFANYEEFYALRASMMDYHGLTASPLQKNPSYYYDLYKRYYGELFQSAYPPNNFSEQMQRVRQHPLFKEGFSVIQTQRDLALLRAIKDALNTYDTIFAQVGFVHLKSIAKILPNVISGEPNGDNEGYVAGESSVDTYRIVHGSDSVLISEALLRDGTSLRFVCVDTGKKYLVSSHLTGLFDELRDVYESFDPNLVAVQGNVPLHPTAIQSLRYSGVGSLYRFKGLERENQIKNWLPAWEEIYPLLADTYDEEELYIHAFIFQYLSYRHIINEHNFPSGADAFDWIYRSLWSTGFPFRPKPISEMDHFFQLVNLRADKPTTGNGTFDDFLLALERMSNQKLLKDIRRVAIDRLFAMLLTNNGEHKRVLVQVDYQFFNLIDEIIGRSKARKAR